MACPNCGTGVTMGAACPACGYTAPAPASDQFGAPMPSGLSGYAPPPTTAQLYPPPQAYEPPAPYAAPVAPYGAPPGFYAPPPPDQMPPGSYYPFAAPARKVTPGFSIAAMAMGVLALLVCPPLFAVLAVTFALLGRGRGEGLWIPGLVAGILGGVAGMLIGAALSFS